MKNHITITRTHQPDMGRQMLFKRIDNVNNTVYYITTDNKFRLVPLDYISNTAYPFPGTPAQDAWVLQEDLNHTRKRLRHSFWRGHVTYYSIEDAEKNISHVDRYLAEINAKKD